MVRSRAFSYKWEHPLLSLTSSSILLRLLPRLPVTYIPPFIFSSITCCRKQFLRKMWQFQLAFRLLISCRIFLCSLTLSNTSFLTWSVQKIFSSTTFQNRPGVSDLLLEASQFQHHIKLCSKCSISLVYSSNLSQFVSKKSPFRVKCSFYQSNPGFNFTSTSSPTAISNKLWIHAWMNGWMDRWTNGRLDLHTSTYVYPPNQV
jgi:hypothetical protein